MRLLFSGAAMLAFSFPAQAAVQITCASGQSATACLHAWLAAEHDANLNDVVVNALAQDVQETTSMQLARSALAARMQAVVLRKTGEASTQWFSVALYRQVPVWTRDATAGEPVHHGKPALRRVDLCSMPAGISAGGAPVMGNEAPHRTSFGNTAMPVMPGTTLRRIVRAGEPVLPGDVKTPADIAVGDTVRFSIHDNRIAITGLGRALESGQLGQPLRLLPTHNGQPITAVALEKK